MIIHQNYMHVLGKIETGIKTKVVCINTYTVFEGYWLVFTLIPQDLDQNVSHVRNTSLDANKHTEMEKSENP